MLQFSQGDIKKICVNIMRHFFLCEEACDGGLFSKPKNTRLIIGLNIKLEVHLKLQFADSISNYLTFTFFGIINSNSSEWTFNSVFYDSHQHSKTTSSLHATSRSALLMVNLV